MCQLTYSFSHYLFPHSVLSKNTILILLLKNKFFVNNIIEKCFLCEQQIQKNVELILKKTTQTIYGQIFFFWGEEVTQLKTFAPKIIVTKNKTNGNTGACFL